MLQTGKAGIRLAIPEICRVHAHFVAEHSDALMTDFGIDLGAVEFDVDTMREQVKMQTGADVDRLTYRELQELQAQQSDRMREGRAR